MEPPQPTPAAKFGPWFQRTFFKIRLLSSHSATMKIRYLSRFLYKKLPNFEVENSSRMYLEQFEIILSKKTVAFIKINFILFPFSSEFF